MADLTVHADVTSGSLSISFGRVSGSNFFNGFSVATDSNAAATSVAIGDLGLSFQAYASTSSRSASFTLGIFNNLTASTWAAFGQKSLSIFTSFSQTTHVSAAQQVAAGQVWNGTSASTTSSLRNAIFAYDVNSNSSYITWTNPDANGTKFINFRLEEAEGSVFYGWIQLDWDITDAVDWSVSISNWAYTSDGPLAAGSTGTPAVPGLGGLAALAIGAAGVRGRRQRMAG